jgi:hypothetical protein
MEFSVGDRVIMKKQHPCGSREWEILRTGADIRIRCLGCGHQIMLPRSKFTSLVRKVETKNPDVI